MAHVRYTVPGGVGEVVDIAPSALSLELCVPCVEFCFRQPWPGIFPCFPTSERFELKSFCAELRHFNLANFSAEKKRP